MNMDDKEKIKELAKAIDKAEKTKDFDLIWATFNNLFPDELGEAMEERLGMK